MEKAERGEAGTRTIVARAFTAIEDGVYIGLGILLAVTVLLLGNAAVSFFRDLGQSPLSNSVVALLDRLLLVLMIIELLYTIQVSFREHSLVPEPFLIVGLVAVTRRILVITAELPKLTDASATVFPAAMIEMGVLTVMIFVLVVSLLMLRRRHPEAVATR